MQNLFQSHPYSTRVGTLIERVTDSGKLAIDWTIVLEICDALGETDEGPKEAIRAIRKRLTSSAGKDHISIWYTLILIEACLKNCGRRFQAQVANRDFLHDLIKVLLPKHNPPIQLQTKILFLIKSWVDASWDVPGRRDLEKVYTALRRKGVQFPTPIECKTLPPPQQSSTMKRPVSSSATSRSTKLASTFRRLTSGALGGGGDCRFKTHFSSLSQNRADDSRRCHYHQQQSVSTSHLQRVGTSESPVTNRARESGRQIRICSGGGSGTGGIEPGAQVLQVVAINGYPVVTRNAMNVSNAIVYVQCVPKSPIVMWVSRLQLYPQQRWSQQLQLQPLMTQPHQQQLQQRHHLHLSLPSTAGMLPHSKDDHEGGGGVGGGGGGGGGGGDNDEDEDDDDDDKLLEAVAEQTQTSWNTDSSAAQLERVFGAGYNNLISHPTDPQTAMSTVQVLPGPQLEPLQPQPAPLPPPAPSHLKALPQPPIKKRTPSEVRRLEEALLLFES
uniref:Tom1 protein 2 n=1 Tax=Echinococcus granulosus TaxID=6210 RepID=A0A068WY40_ECHGR|nr:tom1 protein 2 [Echinococcus granulosus]